MTANNNVIGNDRQVLDKIILWETLTNILHVSDRLSLVKAHVIHLVVVCKFISTHKERNVRFVLMGNMI